MAVQKTNDNKLVPRSDATKVVEMSLKSFAADKAADIQYSLFKGGSPLNMKARIAR